MSDDASDIKRIQHEQGCFLVRQGKDDQGIRFNPIPLQSNNRSSFPGRFQKVFDPHSESKNSRWVTPTQNEEKTAFPPTFCFIEAGFALSLRSESALSIPLV
jgi:hypothetical protein